MFGRDGNQPSMGQPVACERLAKERDSEARLRRGKDRIIIFEAAILPSRPIRYARSAQERSPLRRIGVVKQGPLQEVGDRCGRVGPALEVGRSDWREGFSHDPLCIDPDPCAAPVTDHNLRFPRIEVHCAMIEGQVDMGVVSFDGGEVRQEPESREGRNNRHSDGLTAASGAPLLGAMR